MFPWDCLDDWTRIVNLKLATLQYSEMVYAQTVIATNLWYV